MKPFENDSNGTIDITYKFSYGMQALSLTVSKERQFLFQRLNKIHVAVKNTAAWTIGRACNITLKQH